MSVAVILLLIFVVAAVAVGSFVLFKIMHKTEKNATIAAQAKKPGGEQTILNAVGDAILTFDAACHITMFNPAAERLTGWDAKSAIGLEYNTIFKLKDAKDASLINATDPVMTAIAKKNRVASDNFYFINAKKNKISISIVAAPTYDEAGAISGAVAVFHDISEQKALQRERDEFISTASHEMRTPVATIEGYISMALNDHLATTDDRAKKFLAKAHGASLHLGKLFTDLFSTAKIDDGRIMENREKINITELLLRVVEDQKLLANQKGLSLDLQLGQNTASGHVVAPSYRVLADAERLNEVLTNLLDNAIKYTSKGGVTVNMSGTADAVTITIADTGIGISPEDQKHVFEKFYRANNSFTREVNGTGLGLYIVRNLVERYGGSVAIESELGRGSRFSITLPLVKT